MKSNSMARFLNVQVEIHLKFISTIFYEKENEIIKKYYFFFKHRIIDLKS